MQLIINVRSAGEVNWANRSRTEPVYYGGPPPESGVWTLSTGKIETHINAGHAVKA